MTADLAIEGKLYNLKAKGEYPEILGAECYGLNHSKEFMRFFFIDNFGIRKIRMIPFTEEVEEVCKKSYYF